MSESEEPDWLAELARGGDEVRRQIEQLVQGARQFVRDKQQAMTSGGPVLPFQQRVVRAVGAAMRELVPAADSPVRYGGFKGYAVGIGVFSGTADAGRPAVVGSITGTGGLALPPPGFSGQRTIENPSSGQAERSIGQILAVVLVAIATWRLLVVPERDRAAVDHYLTVIGFGLTVALLIWNTRSKSK